MYTLYILNCDDAFFYVGITSNLQRRIQQHQSMQSPHTKRYSNIELVYTEKHMTRHKAEKRELQLKGWTHAKKKALVENDIFLLKKLSGTKS